MTAALVVACSGGGDPKLQPQPASIDLSPLAPALVVGDSIAMVATVRDAGGNPLASRSVVWASDDSSVASITSAGRVEALKVGSAEISATVGAVRASTRVTVTEPASGGGTVTSVVVAPKSVTLIEGDSFQFGATVHDETGRPLADRALRWSILDPDFAYVDPGGKVTGLRSGTTRVDVAVEGKSADASIKIESAYEHELLFSVAVAVGSSELFTLDINDPAATEAAILLPGAAKADPIASPDGSRIAFVMLSPTETAIYVADRDGSNAVRLTTDPGRYDQPSFSPDGALIAFRGRLPGQGSDVWVMAADGSNAANLTESHGATSQSSPAFSPFLADGSYRIAYSHSEGGMGHIWTMRADGSDKQQVTSSTTDYDDQPSWSPDGDRIVFVRSGPAIFGDLYIVDAAGGAGGMLTPMLGPLPGPQLEPSFSPDGKLIAFASRDGNGIYQIHTVWTDGTRVVKRTSEAAEHASPAWIIR